MQFTLYCNRAKGQCPRRRKPNSDSDSRTLQQSKGLLQGSKQGGGRQSSDPLPLGLWVVCVCVFCLFVLKGKNREAGVNHCLVTFLNQKSGVRMSLDYDSLARCSMAGGVCELILPWRNNLHLYVNDIYNSNFSTLTMLSTKTILVIWFWLMSVHWA